MSNRRSSSRTSVIDGMSKALSNLLLIDDKMISNSLGSPCSVNPLNVRLKNGLFLRAISKPIRRALCIVNTIAE